MLQHAEVSELIPSYALHTLDEKEAREVGAHVETCARCRADLDAYQETMARLAVLAPSVTPSPSLKSRVMARIEPDQVRPSLSEQVQATLRSLGPVWVPVSTLVIMMLLVSNILFYQQTRQSVTPDVIAVTLSGTDAAPDASGVLVIAERQSSGVLVINGLGPLSEAEQYQFWLITPEGTRDSGAVFSVGSDGQAHIEVVGSLALPEYVAFGVTIEPAGGSPGPTGQQVLGSNL